MASSSTALSHPFAGIFPVVSYLSVPGKMSTPLWLMLGSCFLVDLSTIAGGSVLSRDVPFAFLTSSHTFQPWRWMKDPAKLKIPQEYQKARFVSGRLMLYDTLGRAVAADKFGVSVSHMHPSLDVCLLTMSYGADSDAFRSAVTVRQLERYFTLRREEALIGSPLSIVGFRGVGRLGELDTMDPSLIEKMSPSERDSLIRDMQNVEGKQEGATSGLRVERRGVASLTHGKCYNGMSGAPVIRHGGEHQDNNSNAECDGVLYGRAHQHADAGSFPVNEKDFIGYVPSTAIAEWLQDVAHKRKTS